MSSIGEIAKFRTSIQTDTINEFTSASGVTIDGVLLKDANITASGTGSNSLVGNTAIGGAAFTDSRLRVTGSPGTAAQVFGIYADNAFPVTATGTCMLMTTAPSLAAASFNMANLYHYRAYGVSLGAGSSMTNQHGFFVDATLTAASGTNYGFFSNIAASGTTRYNFYANGTAPNFFGGSVKAGGSATTDVQLGTSVGAKLMTGSATYTDNVTAASGTNTYNPVVCFPSCAIAATNAAVTGTVAATVFITGAPTAGSNMTLASTYSLYANAGKAYFGADTQIDGQLITGRTTVTASATGTATITITGSYHAVSGAGGAASTITTINGGSTGSHLILRAVSDSVDISFATGGNLALAGGATFTCDSYLDTICFVYDATLSKWLELYRSSNS